MAQELIPDPYTIEQRQILKHRLMETLTQQGFVIEADTLRLSALNKQMLRAVHAEAVRHNVKRAHKGLVRHENRLLSYIAAGDEVVPERIYPRFVEVQAGSEDELLFRYARLHWSIPVSSGYGRRLRFVVYDQANGKLIGIIGLSDPVFALGARDTFIGWTKENRRKRLVNVMDLFVLGAVPPYTYLLCGKLIALLATSQEVHDAFIRRYGERKALISGRSSDGRLALLTTTSALGRSSIYNRLTFRNAPLFISAGYTAGFGDFQFFNGFYRELRAMVVSEANPSAKHMKWGTGFRNRREVILKALKLLGLPRNFLCHGIAREVFVIPLAASSYAFLRGETDDLQNTTNSVDELFLWFRERWLLPRAARDSRYSTFEPEDWRLWEKA